MKKSYIKGFLEDLVLHLINEQGESYGYELCKLAQEKTNGIVQIKEGALYPVLHKLESNGLLVSEFKEAQGRMRKYYKLAPGSGQVVKTNFQEAAEYVAALQRIFNPNPETA